MAEVGSLEVKSSDEPASAEDRRDVDSACSFRLGLGGAVLDLMRGEKECWSQEGGCGGRKGDERFFVFVADALEELN